MARGTPFSELVSRLRAELRRSVLSATGVDDLPSIKETINHVYATLYMQHDWPHLLKVFSKTLVAGEQYYDFPTGLDIERIDKAVVYWTNTPCELDRGIDFEEYAAFDSGQDVRSEPALRWEARWTGSSVQLEIWPLPSTGTQVVRFRGYQAISRLVNDIDVCLLDDTLVVLFAAAELLASMGAKDAEAKLNLAREHFNYLKHRGQQATTGARLGLGYEGARRDGHITIRVSG